MQASRQREGESRLTELLSPLLMSSPSKGINRAHTTNISNPHTFSSNHNLEVSSPLYRSKSQIQHGQSQQQSPTLSARQLERPLSFASTHSSDAAPLQPPGTLLPGTQVVVNGYTFLIERFLAEGKDMDCLLNFAGGFAHVYLASMGNGRLVVLKRISCPDQSTLNDLLKEAQIHRQLSGHESIVEFSDFSYSTIQNGGGGFELMILMEFCQGGPLVDYLNMRLDNRPTEPEILSIFSQICAAVAHMHSFSPAIIHRDIKIENVLLSNSGSFKLCDFGSCTTDICPANTFLSIQEIRKLEDEISRLTTLQYRAPEMCDLYQKRGLSEKIDIWALGVLLYKLCYYTTPFEESGKMAIMNGTFSFPSYPVLSGELKNLISMMLLVDVNARPDIFQVYHFVCSLRNTPYPLQNNPGPINFSQLGAHIQQASLLDGPFKAVARIGSQSDLSNMNITPMRRGRPQKGTSFENTTASMVNLPQSSTDLSSVVPVTLTNSIPNSSLTSAGAANYSSAFPSPTADPFSNLAGNHTAAPQMMPPNTQFLNSQQFTQHTPFHPQQQQVNMNMNQQFYPQPSNFQFQQVSSVPFLQQQQQPGNRFHQQQQQQFGNQFPLQQQLSPQFNGSFAPPKPPRNRSPAETSFPQ